MPRGAGTSAQLTIINEPPRMRWPHRSELLLRLYSSVTGASVEVKIRGAATSMGVVFAGCRGRIGQYRFFNTMPRRQAKSKKCQILRCDWEFN